MGENIFNGAVFVVYFLGIVWFGVYVARHEKATSQDYFLAGKDLPWYAIGASFIAANISTEHFIGMIGIAFSVGAVVAMWEWGNVITFSLLIWVFLPYYMRTRLYTMPEFLELRYNKTSRALFALVSIVGYVLALLAAVLYAGGLALEGIFGIPIFWGILILAISTSIYTIYGGLVSEVWTDVVQCALLFLGGLLVAIAAWKAVGGIGTLMTEFPDRFRLILPVTHPVVPVTGILTGWLSVGIWYSCTNQFLLQRCLGARDEWHARMGIVFAGFLKVVLPLIVVFPGIAAYKLYPNLARPDLAYPTLVKNLIPAGLAGLILAGLVSAVMSTASSVLNSTSTMFTIDLYREHWCPEASEKQLVRVGRLAGAVIMLVSVGLAFYFAWVESGVFLLIQNVFFYMAPPFAVVFTLGILWRRANGTAALTTIVTGFPLTWLIESVAFERIQSLQPYNNFMHRTFIAWVGCMIIMIAVSLLTPPPPEHKLAGFLWSARTMPVPAEIRKKYHGWRDLRLWWLVFVVTLLSLIGFLIGFQISHFGL
ncbi:MAG: SLC5 family protein [Acidobacteriota bacterium]